MTCHLVGLRNSFPKLVLPMLLLLFFFVVWLNTTIITTIRLLRGCTMPIWVWLMVWSLSLKYSNYFSNNVACVWVYFSSNIKLVALIRSMDSTNNLFPFFVVSTMFLWVEEWVIFTPMLPTYIIAIFLVLTIFVHKFFCS
jgi:hypothetical protein